MDSFMIDQGDQHHPLTVPEERPDMMYFWKIRAISTGGQAGQYAGRAGQDKVIAELAGKGRVKDR